MGVDGSVLKPVLGSARPRPTRPSTRRRATPPEQLIPSAAIGAAALFFALFPEAAGAAAPFPFLIALVLFGLPHGAADGALLLRASPGNRGRVALGYLIVMVLAATALLYAPAPTLLAFLALSWIHFGQADAEEAFEDGDPPWLRNAWAFGRGGLIVGLPFAAAPEQAWRPFGRLAELIGAGAANLPADELAIAGAATATLAVACLGAVGLAARAPGVTRPAFLDWLETALIAALAITADPLFAVGAYFLLVHGFRQSAATGRRLTNSPSLTSRLLRLHLAALPLLLPSWIVLALAAAAAGVTNAFDLAALSLGLYVVATPPHELLPRLLRPERPFQIRSTSQ